MSSARMHGGPDASGAARWDFSTCANALGPCPQALAAVQGADLTRYPDPASQALRAALAALHGVPAWRVLPAASASEFIQRITAVSGRLRPGPVAVPRHAYGDYAAAARAWGRAVEEHERGAAATLQWFANPSSPLGIDEAAPAEAGAAVAVLDAVYEPLRLNAASPWTAARQDQAFVLHSPNKALGLAGVRGAYAIAPRHAAAGLDAAAWCRALEDAAPSWPLSAQAEAMLQAWATGEVQAWVAQSRATLAAWKAALQSDLSSRGFELRASVTPHFVARPPRPVDQRRLREQGIAVRDAASFALPGCWRLSAQPPAARAALLRALHEQGFSA